MLIAQHCCFLQDSNKAQIKTSKDISLVIEVVINFTGSHPNTKSCLEITLIIWST